SGGRRQPFQIRSSSSRRAKTVGRSTRSQRHFDHIPGRTAAARPLAWFQHWQYQILERLGFGGLGIVYLAEHKALRRRVAVKVLPVSLAESRWFLDRFYKEAQAVAALNHPNIVCAHDIDQDGKLHFLVMEYVDGSNF